MVLTEHRPELSCRHSTGSGLLRPGRGKERTSPEGKYAPTHNDQFTEPFAAPAAAAEVDSLECCAPSDPLALPEALRPPAVAV